MTFDLDKMCFVSLVSNRNRNVRIMVVCECHEKERNETWGHRHNGSSSVSV